ncbi:neuropeptide FF receptor 2-like [Saccostrea echinata]|uniref:neuropeptide FF receptor 2-like n=1 Tax=Saccostrea echinata TaxID=191078 RepID=UPI002A812AD7|nr:neuropeptide FF receptor 2-like [Saccostrea echinata]
MEISVDISNEDFIYHLPNAIILVCYIVLGSLGNVSVLIVYMKDMKNVFSSGRLFIPFLAFVDLITLNYNGWVEFASEVQQFHESKDKELACKINKFIGLILVITSGCIYFAIAVHRYILICRPHSKEFTLKVKIAVMVTTVLFIVGVSVPNYIFSGFTSISIKSKRFRNETETVFICGTDEHFENATSSNAYHYILTVNSLIWSSLMAIIYILVGRRIRQRIKETCPKPHTKDDDTISSATDSANHGRIPDHSQRQKPRLVKQITAKSITTFITNNRLSWMFILMTVLNVVCYVPKLILDIHFNRDRYFFIGKPMSLCLLLVFFDNFYLFNNVVNPFIYGFFDKEFRNRFKKRFCTYCK